MREPPLPPAVWQDWDDERLLGLRLRQLDLHIEGTDLGPRVAELEAELAGAGLAFRPHYWLADEWFTPDGVPGIAIPFYLAHPRLARLEQHQMLDVEGGTPEWCLRILRHEAGHAIDNAFRLRFRRARQKVFGRASLPYPEHYTFRPHSKRFVVHLGAGYAQSHPAEDFAETFAVWLTPGSDWQLRYRGWPALRKLEYVDALMRELSGRTPPVRNRREVDPLRRLSKTLREHYREKRARYVMHLGEFYDRDLSRLFAPPPDLRDRPPAAAFVTRVRKEVRRLVRRWTGVYQYTIDQVIDEMVRRCQALDLRLRQPEEASKHEFAILLTVHTMNYLHSGRHRLAL